MKSHHVDWNHQDAKHRVIVSVLFRNSLVIQVIGLKQPIELGIRNLAGVSLPTECIMFPRRM